MKKKNDKAVPAGLTNEHRLTRGAKSRQDILTAALAELSEKGIEKFTVVGVANRLGRDKSTIHNHFPGGGRSALLIALAEPHVERMKQAVADNIGKLPFFDFVRSAALVLASEHKDPENRGLLVLKEKESSVEMSAAWASFEDSTINHMAKYAAQDFNLDPAGLDARFIGKLVITSYLYAFERWLAEPNTRNLDEEAMLAIEAAQKFVMGGSESVRNAQAGEAAADKKKKKAKRKPPKE